MINALGLLEVDGMVAAIDAADERRTPRTDKPVVAKHNGKRRRHAVGILASGAICHGLPAAVCREAVVDVASADAGMGVRELHPIPDLNKLT